MLVTASNAQQIANGIWLIEMPPHNVRMFGSPINEIGGRSVLGLRTAKFNASDSTLSFSADAVTPLNVGTQAAAIAIDMSEGTPSITARDKQTPDSRSISYGPGDQEFLALARSILPKHMHETARNLLASVRSRSAGDLLRGQKNNFSNTPDNFWYVIIQPRVEELSVTVRGEVAHFADMARLPILDDRGNTRFKVTGMEDIPAALEIIFHARRKR